MSKDVVIAGVIVAACLGLVTVAFVVPKQKTVTPEIAQNDPLPPSPTDPLGPSTPSDPFANNTTNFTPIPDPTNPFTRPNNPKGRNLRRRSQKRRRSNSTKATMKPSMLILTHSQSNFGNYRNYTNSISSSFSLGWFFTFSCPSTFNPSGGGSPCR